MGSKKVLIGRGYGGSSSDYEKLGSPQSASVAAGAGVGWVCGKKTCLSFQHIEEKRDALERPSRLSFSRGSCLCPPWLSASHLASLVKAFIRRALLTAAVPYFLFSCFWAALPGRLQTMTPACSQLRATRGEWESSIRWGHCEENGEVVL